MSITSVLAAYGHPDDEGQVTGTLAHFIEQGVRVTLVCATRGEVGEISDPALSTNETLWYTRELELRASMAQIGLRDVRFLPFRDSGMAGTTENEDPRCLHQAPAEAVVGHLVHVIREVRPDLVFTWDPNGGYGHPDHIAIHTHTVEAFHAAGDALRYPAQGVAWQPQRLLYSVIPRSVIRAWRDEMAARGEDTSSFDSPEGQAMGWPDEDVQLYLDVTAYIPAKWAALTCHRTQFGDDHSFATLPDEEQQRGLGREAFVQAWPTLESGGRLIDLFPQP